MLQDPNAVCSFARLNDIKRFSIKCKEGANTLVFKSAGEPLESELKRFLDIMALSQGGRYIFEGSTSTDEKSQMGKFYEEFSNLGTTAQTAQVAGVGASQVSQGVSPEQVEKMIAEAVERERTANELRTLKQEISELKQENKDLQSPMRDLINRVAPLAAPVIQGLVNKFSPAVGIAGNNQQSVNAEFTPVDADGSTEDQQELTADEANRLNNAITKFAAVEPDFIEMIEVIAEMANTQDPMYTMAKNFLTKK
jgi:hypothetical protein